jgi:hypothetical protein
VSGSCADFLWDDNDFHGTAVASILGGGANNGVCAVGVAPEVTISSCYALGNPGSVLAEKLDSFDISQNSYGTDGCAPTPANRRKLQSCPFKFQDPGIESPCSVCDFSSSEPKSRRCELAIIEHCSYNYREDSEGCIEFLDLFIAGGRCYYNTLSEQEHAAIETRV